MSKSKLEVTKVGTKLGKRTKYTIEEKIEVLRLLKENSYNYKKTSLETGVVYGTLKNWFSQYKDRINNISAVDIIAENVEVNLAKTKVHFIENHFEKLNELAEAAIKRALILIENEGDLSKVNGTIKIIGDMFAKIAGMDEGEKGSNTTNLIQQSIIMMNQIKNKSDSLEKL